VIIKRAVRLGVSSYIRRLTMLAWAGKVLEVDLTNGTVTEEPTIPKYQRYIGGVGIGFKVMWDEVPR
jgi:aldehyde:ferredoxin oxidoreductase